MRSGSNTLRLFLSACRKGFFRVAFLAILWVTMRTPVVTGKKAMADIKPALRMNPDF
jgi:hypothetical protein